MVQSFTKIKKAKIKSLLLARNLIYHLESIPIVKTQKILAKGFSTYKPTPHEIDQLKEEIVSLIEKDTAGFLAGYFPDTTLFPKQALNHYKRYFSILLDNVTLSLRKRKNETKTFHANHKAHPDKYPEYYLRNFHFQTDGYLSEDSAEMYEHQVEILFKGTAAPMRRRMISMLKEEEGLGSQFLELGSGVGSTTEFMTHAFKAAEITCVDLSESYLQKAKINLKDYKNINYIRGAAENLSFKDASFDMVYSTYLMHELPGAVRVNVLKEANRLLKPGGYIAIADSTQLDDKVALNWVLKDFPRNFHEPYYMNYIKTPLEDLLEAEGFEIYNKDISFLTKTLVAKKIIQP